MNADTQKQIEQKYVKKMPEFNAGDTIAMTTIIREGDKQRTQTFKGIVLMIKGEGIRKTFTIRKISDGIGVEKVMPLNSPNIQKIVVVKRGDVRRAKIFYMRKRIGKKALKINDRAGFYDEAADDVTNDEITAEVAVEAPVDEVKE